MFYLPRIPHGRLCSSQMLMIIILILHLVRELTWLKNYHVRIWAQTSHTELCRHFPQAFLPHVRHVPPRHVVRDANTTVSRDDIANSDGGAGVTLRDRGPIVPPKRFICRSRATFSFNNTAMTILTRMYWVLTTNVMKNRERSGSKVQQL